MSSPAPTHVRDLGIESLRNDITPVIFKLILLWSAVKSVLGSLKRGHIIMSLPSVESDAAALETLLRTLSSEPPARRFRLIAEENAKLRDDNKSLVEENTVTSRTIHRLQGKVDSTECRLNEKAKELQGLVEKKEQLANDLGAMETKFRASEKRGIELEDHYKHQQKAIKDELKENTDELKRLAEFSIVLEQVDENEDKM
jgi:chromosome segregation ATPase